MFGMANQLLAVIALAVVTTVLVNSGRGRYAPVTLLPMLFVATTTTTTAYYEITGKFCEHDQGGRRRPRLAQHRADRHAAGVRGGDPGLGGHPLDLGQTVGRSRHQGCAELGLTAVSRSPPDAHAMVRHANAVCIRARLYTSNRPGEHSDIFRFIP